MAKKKNKATIIVMHRSKFPPVAATAFGPSAAAATAGGPSVPATAGGPSVAATAGAPQLDGDSDIKARPPRPLVPAAGPAQPPPMQRLHASLVQQVKALQRMGEVHKNGRYRFVRERGNMTFDPSYHDAACFRSSWTWRTAA
jgi:hypothetical protein